MVNGSSIKISGSYSYDKSGIKKISIYVINETGGFRYYEAILTVNGFSKMVKLYEGDNTILLAAEDNAGNKKEYSLSVFMMYMDPQ